MVWEDVVEVIRPRIEDKGYFFWEKSFQDFKNECGIRAPQRAPMYLSLDFWSQQRPELTQNNWYVIRFEQGNFGIFSTEHFPKPYLELDYWDAEEIECELKQSCEHLKRAFKRLDWNLSSAENTLLELARFYGFYEFLAEIYDGVRDYHIGPRGGMTQRFDVLFIKRNNDSMVKFEYDGQVELDYSVWTEKRVFVIEAKSYTRGGLDIGWHKLAYHSQRFFGQIEEDGLIINPIYFLRTIIDGVNVILLFMFDNMSFKNGGVVLNDSSKWNQERVFKINLDKLDSHLI